MHYLSFLSLFGTVSLAVKSVRRSVIFSSPTPMSSVGFLMAASFSFHFSLLVALFVIFLWFTASEFSLLVASLLVPFATTFVFQFHTRFNKFLHHLPWSEINIFLNKFFELFRLFFKPKSKLLTFKGSHLFLQLFTFNFVNFSKLLDCLSWS